MDRSCHKDEGEDPCCQENKNSKFSSLCSKCKIEKAIYLYRNDPKCRNCYMLLVEHKFRQTLRTQLFIKDYDNVLVALSGGPHSTFLTQSIANVFVSQSGRNIRFKTHIIHVDCSEIYEEKEEAKRKLEVIKDFCNRLNLELSIIPLKFSLSSFSYTTIENSEKSELNDIINSFESFIAFIIATKNVKTDIIRQLIRYSICQFAKENLFSKILVGDSGQSTAANIFKSVVKGRGFNISETCSFLVSNYMQSGADLGRPCRDFLTKEILIFLKEFNLLNQTFTYFPKTKPSTLPYNGNIDHMIEDFMDRMQSHQPTTIHTVLRTAEKILQKGDGIGKCIICNGDIDKIANFMEIGSLNKQSPDSTSFLVKSGLMDKCQDPSKLCFGCRRLIESSSNGKIICQKESPPLKEIVERMFGNES